MDRNDEFNATMGITTGTRRPVEEKWLSKIQICEECGMNYSKGCSLDTYLNNFAVLTDSNRKLISEGKSRTYYYSPEVLKAFQMWLMKNQASQGRASDMVKQLTTNAVVTELEEKWYSREQICEMCKVSGQQTWVNFMKYLGSLPIVISNNRKLISEGKSRTYYYSPEVLKAFQMWLMKNQANQGRASDTVKEATTNMVAQGIVGTEIGDTPNIQYLIECEKTKQSQAQKCIQESLAQQQKQITAQMRLCNKNPELMKIAIKPVVISSSRVMSDILLKDGRPYVYIIKEGIRYKIGHASKHVTRADVADAMNPDCEYIAYKKFNNKNRAKDFEADLHNKYADKNYKFYKNTTSTEWFVLKPEEVDAIIATYGFTRL